MTLKRIFISKNISEVEPYRSQFEELGYSVIAHSFLSFSGVDFEISQPYDAIFFGSPRAVTFFLEGASIDQGVKIACIGGKTAEVLESLGYEVAFRGEKSGDPKGVGEEFKIWLESSGTSTAFSPRVLFPVSDRSLGTVSGLIAENQKEEVVVYKTEIGSRFIEACDVYVFTSPSNVEGYLGENEIPEGGNVVAWGKSCEVALELRGVLVDCVLVESSFEELLETLSINL